MKKLFTLAALILLSLTNVKAQDAGSSGQVKLQRNIIKFQPLSLLNQHVTIGYERLISKRISIETKAGFVIASSRINSSHQQKHDGLTLRSGVKFILSQNLFSIKPKTRHPLSGIYIKPELAFSYLDRSYNRTDFEWYTMYAEVYHIEEQGMTAAANLNIGKQWISASGFSVDFSFGMGYGYSNVEINDGFKSTNRYGFRFFSEGFGITTTSSLAIGFAF